MNTAANSFLNNSWWSLEAIKTKWCIGMKWITYLSLLYLSSFYSTAVVFSCLIFQTRGHLCLFSKYANLNFCFTKMFCQYIAIVIIWSVFRTLLTMIEFFAKISSDFGFITDVYQVSEFVSDHDGVVFSNQNSLWKVFFLRITIKRKIRVMSQFL